MLRPSFILRIFNLLDHTEDELGEDSGWFHLIQCSNQVKVAFLAEKQTRSCGTEMPNDFGNRIKGGEDAGQLHAHGPKSVSDRELKVLPIMHPGQGILSLKEFPPIERIKEFQTISRRWARMITEGSSR